MQVIHAQLRMECSLLADHLYKLHVKENYKCFVCNEREDAHHFFMECKVYSKQREVLRNKLGNAFNLKVILFGDHDCSFDDRVKIFQAVHEFIETSKRFDT